MENHKINYCLNASPLDLNILPAGGTLIGSGISDGMFVPGQAGAGEHNVIYYYTDSNQCTNSLVVRIIVEVCSGISGIDGDAWTIYPNPFDDRIEVQTTYHNYSDIRLRLFNSLGQAVYSESRQLVPGVNSISLQSLDLLPAGVYHLELHIGDEKTVKKLLKSK